MRAPQITGKPITQARLHQRVVEELLKQIVGGALPPGTTLPSEPELARQFGVSRIVIREAIRILVEKGLVAVRHGSGMWVQPPEQWDQLDPMILLEQIRSQRDPRRLEELLELRSILEVAAAELATLRRTPEQVARLQDLLERMRAAVADPAAYGNLDQAFHQAIAEAAGNRLLGEARQPLGEVLATAWLLTGRAPERLARAQQEHEELYAAIAAGDPFAARQAMQRHLEQEAEAIRSELALPARDLATIASDGREAAD
ncbi:MAG: FadR family transcriptional regulator [Thermomicrobium sp.]|nr:FadR family transcriptional regulator [Thermomicrobium sp.]